MDIYYVDIQYKSTTITNPLFAGNTIKPKRHMLGNNGLVDCGPSVDVVSSFHSWLQQGFPHHVCVVEGHHAKRFKALADTTDVTVVPNM